MASLVWLNAMNSFQMNSRMKIGSLPQPGDMLGDFQIVTFLDQGGHAAVFEANHRKLDRKVAVKVLLPEVVGNVKGVVERFLREIDLVKRVEHANVVRLYDFGSTDSGQLWMAAELVKGVELHELIKTSGALRPQRVRDIMLQILSGLAAAHEVGIIHRDLKPSNIMLTRKGADDDVVKILDFGIAKTLESDDELAGGDVTGDVKEALGTPRYMAPEVLKHTTIAPYTDVYSAGIILAEMLTGKPAFDADTLMQIMAAHMVKRIILPDWIETSPFGAIIHRATSKEPLERYPSALEFHAALKQVSGAAIELVEHQRAHAGEVSDPITSPGVSVHLLNALPTQLSTGPIPSSGYQEAALYTVQRPFYDRYKFAIVAVVVALIAVVVVVAMQEDSPPISEAEGTEAAQATPTSAVAAPDPEVVAPAPTGTVEVTFKSVPAGATVFDDQFHAICEPTPCVGSLSRSNNSTSVTFQLLEYKSVGVTIVPNKNKTTDVILVPVAIDSEMSIEVKEKPTTPKRKEKVKVDPFAVESFD